MATILRGATVLTLDGADTTHNEGYVVIEDGRIAAVGAGDGPAIRAGGDTVHDLAGHIVLPGLINVHTHAAMALFRGLAEGYSLLTLDGWYRSIRVLEEALAPGDLTPAVALSCAEMLRLGTTTFSDQYFGLQEYIPAVRESGMRAVLAYGIVELHVPGAREREIRRAAAFLDGDDTGEDGRIHRWIGPHAVFTDNDLDTLLDQLKLVDAFGCGLHIHLSATESEDDLSRERYGIGIIAKLDEIGFLDHRVIAAHCNALRTEDMPLLAQKPFTVAYAPAAAMRAGFPAAPVAALLRHGVTVAIGTDNVCNNNSYDLLRAAHEGALLAMHRERDPHALPARDALRMVTTNAARALGLEGEIGSLEVGKRADVIAVDARGPGGFPRHDPATTLVHGLSGMHTRHVWVDGQQRVADGGVLGADWDALGAAVGEKRAALLVRAGRVE